MSGDQQTKWMIRVNGSDLTSVDVGETVEIGRKPLRPIASTDTRRIEILDDTRSMSKRHAQFSVKSSGDAILRDLNSTNGTFLVRPGDELIRLPEGSDFAMTDDTIRIQFGDVPVDFIRYIDDNTDEHEEVPNLFDYALDNTPNTQDAADMSVDDILNLRAGEPTNIFDASRVRQRARELQQAEQQSFVPFEQPIEPARAEDDSDEPAKAAPRNLFEDAQNVAAGKIEEPAVTQPEFKPKSYRRPRHADHRTGDRLIGVEELSKFQPFPASAIAQQNEPDLPRVVAPSASNLNTLQTQAQQSAPEQQSQETSAPQVAMPAQQPVQNVQPAQQSEHPQADMTEPMTQRPAVQEVEQVQQSFVQPTAEPVEQQAAQQNEQVPVENPVQSSPQSDERDEYSRFKPSAAALEETQSFTPAFEPGSVFERVAKGEFAHQEAVIEVAGFTSDDARQSDDYSKQFEMATHEELLPFLAMNPSLYDDLYAWLAAQANDDIDAALSRNPGYEEYRKATGK